MDALEDHDDVEAVYANFDIPDAVLEAVSRVSRAEGIDMIEVGEAAPDFTLPGIATASAATTRCRSSAAATSCSRSTRRQHARAARASCARTATTSPSSSAIDAVLLGISPQDVDSHEKFATKHNFPFPLLADTDKTVIDGVRRRRADHRRAAFGVRRRRRRHRPLRRPQAHRRHVRADRQARAGARIARLTGTIRGRDLTARPSRCRSERDSRQRFRRRVAVHGNRRVRGLR